MNIRRFTDKDARRTSHLIRRTLRVSNGPDYPATTIDSFVDHFSPAKLREISRERDMYVVEVGRYLVATGSLAGGSIATFFVNPRYQGRGIGTALLEHLERLALAKGLSELHLNASFTAMPFYAVRGYQKTGKQPKPDAPFVPKKGVSQ